MSLCAEGAGLEFRGDLAAARRTYREAWEAAQDDIDRCVAAHYVGHLTDDLELQLNWHRDALGFANQCDQSEVAGYYPSLYACMARSLRRLGREREAEPLARVAEELGFGVGGGGRDR